MQVTGSGRKLSRSNELSEAIAKLIPGGVDSPFRSFKEVGGHTIFFNRAQGPYLFDVDGNRYIDFLGAWGPAILGHSHPAIFEACQKALALGPVFGSPHELELEMAELLIATVSSLEKVRFVNSGTEAVMSAVRLARGATGRDTIIMFEGCYHGHSDSVLASTGHSSSSGIPATFSKSTVLIPYNDIPALEQFLSENAKQVAAVLIEPVAGSMGVIPPAPGYLAALEKLCRKHDVLLIFDEVLTGLRVARGGAQALYGVKPDITCFGKALGGGMPIGAYGGRADLMDQLEPIGKVYQAGTFSGNPVTMAGGIATLTLLNETTYETLERLTKQLFDGLQRHIDKLGCPVQLQRVGSMFAILFSQHPVTNFQESLSIDAERFARFFHLALNEGMYLPPSSVDAACVSAAHTSEDIEAAISAFSKALEHCAT